LGCWAYVSDIYPGTSTKGSTLKWLNAYIRLYDNVRLNAQCTEPEADKNLSYHLYIFSYEHFYPSFSSNSKDLSSFSSRPLFNLRTEPFEKQIELLINLALTGFDNLYTALHIFILLPIKNIKVNDQQPFCRCCLNRRRLMTTFRRRFFQYYTFWGVAYVSLQTFRVN
jgi:hypothetical protein